MKKRGLHISSKGVVLNGNTINNINKIKPEKKEKKKQPGRRNNNKMYRDFISIAREHPKYMDMSYQDVLRNSKEDYEMWKAQQEFYYE